MMALQTDGPVRWCKVLEAAPRASSAKEVGSACERQ